MNNRTTEEAVVQNLVDAGCDEDIITAFIEDIRNDRINNALKMLAAYRRTLLDGIHKEQKQLDCLDYLVYTMQKSAKA